MPQDPKPWRSTDSQPLPAPLPPQGQPFWGLNNPNSVVGQLADIGSSVINTFMPKHETVSMKPGESLNDLHRRQMLADADTTAQGFALGVQPIGPEGFYSHAEKVLNESKQGLWRGPDLLNYLKKNGVKDEELRFTGLEKLANLPKTTRDEALGLVRNGPRVGEKILPSAGEPQYDTPDLNLPGQKTNYKEILLQHRPQFDQADFEKWLKQRGSYSDIASFKNDFPENQREAVERYVAESAAYNKFRQSHYEEGNILTHIRVNDRKTMAGEGVTHLDEAQSDWGNKARKKGIREPVDPELEADYQKQKSNYEQLRDRLNSIYDLKEEGMTERDFQQLQRQVSLARQEMERVGAVRQQGEKVADAPFIRGSWNELAAKRHLLEAARNPNSQYATWTTGEQQAERYGLDKYYDWIHYSPSLSELRVVPRIGPDAGRVLNHRNINESNLHQYVGNELSDKLLNEPLSINKRYTPYEGHFLKGPDLKVPDEGKRRTYDVAYRKNIENLTKQKAQMVDIESGKEPLSQFNQQNFVNWLTEQGQPTGEAWQRLGTAGQTRLMNEYNKARQSIGQKVWGVKMTPELRNKILKEGFPLYSALPIAAYEFARPSRDTNPLPPPPMMKAH